MPFLYLLSFLFFPPSSFEQPGEEKRQQTDRETDRHLHAYRGACETPQDLSFVQPSQQARKRERERGGERKKEKDRIPFPPMPSIQKKAGEGGSLGHAAGGEGKRTGALKERGKKTHSLGGNLSMPSCMYALFDCWICNAKRRQVMKALIGLNGIEGSMQGNELKNRTIRLSGT
mmetsp:Transcript_31232/g.61652  ORF Transcript_31232/g.61652 Transcript_31232/m.61652 type:complete len:174 (-) Transcript_31232:571-1092(-)